MAVKCTPVVFITANVGSIFEEPAVMLKIWTREFLSTIARLDPKFIALHCQEVGGKNYEKSMQHVEHFVQLLIDSEELRLFDKMRIFLDEDYSSAENFTALGNFYFIHQSITDALIYDFEAKTFRDVSGKEIYTKNIEHVPTKQKSKFPLQYFPDCKWSRKGFLRTRWNLNGAVFDLVNIHLFHDASNFVAIKSFPSIYSDTRRRALAYTLERFQTDEHGSVPLFIFGDFNFRADTKGVVKHLSEGLKCSATEGEASQIEFTKEDRVVLTLGKKEFSHSDHQAIFSSKEGNWLRDFDKELEAFADQLFEFSISFPPSYPFEENSTGDKCYMKTRCPAWCDRVILSHAAIPLVRDTTGPGNVEYGLMGRETCMGDHKPVYLKVHVKGSSEKETCPEANPLRVLPRPNAQNTISTAVTPPSDRTQRSPIPNHSDIDIEKLACSIEALISQNAALTREAEESIEPDLSRCSSCRTHKHKGRLADNPGGEQFSNGDLQVDDEKLLGLFAYGIKIPDKVLQKLKERQKGEVCEETCVAKKTVECEKPATDNDRFGTVKRVNSASLVENKPRKEDWKNTRCNSDVSWNPCTIAIRQSPEVARIWGINKSFNRGNSKIRLISSSNSLNVSLPRLTSHHSSSDEEWFEEVEESGDDDDALEVSCEHITDKRRLQRVKNDGQDGGRQTVVNEAGDKSPISAADGLANDSKRGIYTIGKKDPAEESGNDITDMSTGSSRLDTFPSTESGKMSTREGGSTSDGFEGTQTWEAYSSLSTKTYSISDGLQRRRHEVLNANSTNAGKKTNESLEHVTVETRRIAESAIPDERTELQARLLPDTLLTTLNESYEGKTKDTENCDLVAKESTESWETIELCEKKLRDDGICSDYPPGYQQKKVKAGRGKCLSPMCCCSIQ